MIRLSRLADNTEMLPTRMESDAKGACTTLDGNQTSHRISCQVRGNFGGVSCPIGDLTIARFQARPPAPAAFAPNIFPRLVWGRE